jgi:menaquinol-cytochrome c reductase iron-sulfur subunit
MRSETAERQQVERRTFLSYVIVAIGAFITAVLGIPLVGSLIAPALRGREASWETVGPTTEFQVGQPKAATVTITTKDGWITQQESKGVWVIKQSDTSFVVYNGRCVHLGCAYNWNATQQEFDCPCHGGRYALDGKVLGGPPPRPLDTLQWRVDQGNLVIQYEDFRLGIPQKEVA